MEVCYFSSKASRTVSIYPHKNQTFDDGRTLLRADYSIDCDVTEHTSYRALAIIMAIVYPIGSLAAFSAVLWKHRDRLYPPQIRGRSKEDNAIAQEAKRANAFALRRFGLLHDACESIGTGQNVFRETSRKWPYRSRLGDRGKGVIYFCTQSCTFFKLNTHARKAFCWW